MTQTGQTDNGKKGVPGRMSVRVRLVLCTVLLAACVAAGGIWLSSHVDLGSAALATVEQSSLDARRHVKARANSELVSSTNPWIARY